MSVRPSIHEVAFDCPHCGAFTSQFWFQLFSESMGKERRTPYILTQKALAEFLGRTRVACREPVGEVNGDSRVGRCHRGFRQADLVTGRVTSCANRNGVTDWLLFSLHAAPVLRT
jgi:hypothetical protein